MVGSGLFGRELLEQYDVTVLEGVFTTHRNAVDDGADGFRRTEHLEVVGVAHDVDDPGIGFDIDLDLTSQTVFQDYLDHDLVWVGG